MLCMEFHFVTVPVQIKYYTAVNSTMNPVCPQGLHALQILS